MIARQARARIALAATGIAVWALAGGCGRGTTGAATAQGAAVASVQVVSPSRGPVTRSITLPGELAAWQQVTLHAKIAGYVKTISVDRGDRVTTDQVLVDLEAPELVADVAKAKADLTLATTLSSRVDRAHEKAPDLVVAENVDKATAERQVATATLARAETLLGFATIRAPFDGVVTERFVDVGAFVPAATAAAAASTAALVTIVDLGRIRVEIAVPETEASWVQPGTPTSIRVDEVPGDPINQPVTRISWALDRDTRTMTAEVDVDNPRQALRPGMLAHVTLGVQTHENALLVPAAAVVTEKAGTFAFVVGDGNRVRKTAVRTGFADDRRVEIAGGIDESVRLAISGKPPLSDGQVVQAAESK
ncbi:MAG TPA: efflux RND transporter periplasmic adaptor subunit [Candidatus Binatia bacterium]|jgi:membrane fusion protein (multidrug efflux system)